MPSDPNTLPRPGRALEALARLREKIRRAFVTDGVVTISGLLIAGLAISFLADYLLTLPRGVRTVFLSLGGVILAFLIHRRITRPLALKLSDTDLANLVERANPELSQELITAVELTERSNESASYVSQDLLESVVASVDAKVARIPFDRIFSFRRLQRKGWAAMGGLAIALGFAGLNPALTRIWLSRNLLLSAQPWPKETQLELVKPPQPILLAIGDDLPIEVRAVRGTPSAVVVDSRIEGGSTRTDVLPEVSPGFFQKTLENVSKPFRFRIRGGDDELGPFDVDVRLRPRIDMSSIRLWCEYPGYTGLATTPGDEPIRFGNLKVPTGTKVRYRMASNVPIERAFFNFKQVQAAPAAAPQAGEASASPKPAPTPAPKPVETAGVWPDAGAEPLTIEPPGEFAGAFEVKENGQYYFQLEATGGFQSVKPDRFRVEAVPDLKPIVKIIEPERLNEEVTAVARIPIRVSASDDYKVAKVVLQGAYFAPGQEKGFEQFRDFPRWAKPAEEAATPKPEEPRSGSRVAEEDEILISVAELATGGESPAAPGGRFQFWAQAMDTAGQVKPSEERFLVIVEKEELLRVLTDQLLIVRDQLKDVLKKQKSARKDLEDFQSQIALKEKIEPAEAPKLFRHKQDQRRVTQSLERESVEMGRILQRTVRNSVGDEPWKNWVTGVRDDVETLAKRTSPQVEQSLETLQKEVLESAQSVSRLGGIAATQQDLERELENLVLRLSEFGDKNAQIQRLREIRRRMDEIRIETRARVQGKPIQEPQK